MHGRDGACFHQSTHGQCALQTQRDIRAIQREIRFDVPRQKQRGSGNGATAPTSHTDTRSRAEVHLRALELVGIRIPRGGSGGSRDREQDQRRRADPRGPPPAPHPLHRPRTTRSPRPRSLLRERRRRRKRPQCGERQWPARAPPTGHRAARRGAGSGARVLARRRIPELLRREGMNGKSWSRGATRSELGRGEEKNSGEHGAARVMRACREKPASVF
jgi:hypothetical protein|uniref:Uncharacterized protein n=1 Tax=Zea mays TaxID=4577 RepID=B4FQ67_MAIZE|nr:unknown [Zea mays]